MKGSKIRQKLYQARVSQKELARLLDVSPQAVTSILHGKDVRTSTVERICQVLDLPITFFYDEEGDIKPNSFVQVGQNNQNVYAGQKIWKTSDIEEKVRGLLREQDKSLARLCAYIGMTTTGLHKVFVRDTCNINILTKIAEFFSVPIAYFLPEGSKVKTEEEMERELENLRGQVKAYENAFRLLAGERDIEPTMAVMK